MYTHIGETRKSYNNLASTLYVNHFTKKLPISNLQEALIPPQTLVSLTCKLSHNDPRFFLKQKKEKEEPNYGLQADPLGHIRCQCYKTFNIRNL